jgi:hypothetical protein
MGYAFPQIFEAVTLGVVVKLRVVGKFFWMHQP